jgi:CubicO group peptidase (beta-lactamase class C family)
VRRRLAIVLVLVPVVALIAIANYLRPIAPVATGYSSKIVCSGHFVSERSVSDVQGDLPSNPLVPLLWTRVDQSARHGPDQPAGHVANHRLVRAGPGLHAVGRTAAMVVGRTGRPGALVPGCAGGRAHASCRGGCRQRGLCRGRPGGPARNTRAVVVLQGGEVVTERYAPGITAETPLLGWSMTKSVANAMVGRLVQRGQIDLDDAGLRPEWSDDRADITVRHLLQMTSGLAFDETYDVGHDATDMLFRPGSTAGFAAAKPLEHRPGTHWYYSSGTSNVLCDVAADAAGGQPLDIAASLVFRPLGMSSALIEPDASGGLMCSTFMYATARDWARFGQWFLQDGVWNGQQLLPEGWVEWSTTPVDLDTEAPYGAHWWLNRGADGTLRFPGMPADAYWASGNEGQQVVIVPSADLVVVRLGLTHDFPSTGWGLEELVADLVAALD